MEAGKILPYYPQTPNHSSDTLRSDGTAGLCTTQLSHRTTGSCFRQPCPNIFLHIHSPCALQSYITSIPGQRRYPVCRTQAQSVTKVLKTAWSSSWGSVRIPVVQPMQYNTTWRVESCRTPQSRPLFHFRHGPPLTAKKFRVILCLHLESLGLSTAHFNTHSFRIGAAMAAVYGPP